ncbi:MAG: sulfotransferase family protein [Actinomycetia bacterium]|nr:sulfotransferase family protein [Actinomycetes bacterium]MCP4084565.1 sulfotransferase family protein [Actinomycetes bacterium]
MTLRINCWSGPRNISTALMYSFRERADTTIVDEPLYAHYLRVTSREHPGADEVRASQDNDGDSVVRDLILGPVTTPVLFCKQMAHHLIDLDRGFLGEVRNLLLTRHPEEMLRSLAIQLPDAGLVDTGLENLVGVLESVLAAGEEPVVIDSRALLADPAAVLAEVCGRLGLEFDPAMLSWPAGPKPEDGVWARHWYRNVHRSTGFEAHRPSSHPWPDRLDAVLEAAVPLYERLASYAVV